MDITHLAKIWKALQGFSDLKSVFLEVLGRYALRAVRPCSAFAEADQDDALQIITWIKTIYDFQRTYCCQSPNDAGRLDAILLEPEFVGETLLLLLSNWLRFLPSEHDASRGACCHCCLSKYTACAVLSGIRLLLLTHPRLPADVDRTLFEAVRDALSGARPDKRVNPLEASVIDVCRLSINRQLCQINQNAFGAGDVIFTPACGEIELPTSVSQRKEETLFRLNGH